MIRKVCIFTCALLGWVSSPASAQPGAHRFEVGAQVSALNLSEFDESDVGLGARFAWRPASPIGIEAEMTMYPRDYPNRRAFSRGRHEGLFGITVGPRFDRFRPFARLRPGFVRFQEAPRPFPCILIYPPPLQCSLASGHTAWALDAGGGVELQVTPRTLLRVDAGGLALKYPGPVLDSERAVRRNGFLSNNLRVAVGASVTF